MDKHLTKQKLCTKIMMHPLKDLYIVCDNMEKMFLLS